MTRRVGRLQCKERDGRFQCARRDGHDGDHWNANAEIVFLRERVHEFESAWRLVEEVAALKADDCNRLRDRVTRLEAWAVKAHHLDGCEVRRKGSPCNCGRAEILAEILLAAVPDSAPPRPSSAALEPGDAAPRSVSPSAETGPGGEGAAIDLDLLRKLASGEGGRRTGALMRAGLIRVEVTEAGVRALAEPFGGHQMDFPGGPRCSCGKPSTRESGWCGEEHPEDGVYCEHGRLVGCLTCKGDP